MKYLGLAIFITLTGATAAEDTFIEGFPDVPLLAGIQEDESSRTVFDTPSGTVAETTLIADQSAQDILLRYAADLPALGWACNGVATELHCVRESDELVFEPGTSAPGTARIILRLVPRK